MTAVTRKPLGEIFVEGGLLTKVAVQRLVEHAKSKKIRFGEFLEGMGIVNAAELAEALAKQYRCRKLLQFAHYSYSRNLLRVVPLDLALRHTIFPLKVEDGKLALAVADPTMTSVFDDIAERNGVKIFPCISTRSEIRRAIARHYLGRPLSDQLDNSILIVENDEQLRRSMAKTLERRGYLVETAGDGSDALIKVFTFRPKLVITDRVLPKLDGLDFLPAIRQIPEFRYMPVLLTTVAATQDEEKQALETGFFDLIRKPIRDVILLTRVSRAMQSSENLYRNAG